MIRTISADAGDGVVFVVGLVLVGLLVAAIPLVVVRTVRSLRTERWTSDEQRMTGVAAWVRAAGGRYRFGDAGVAREFAGSPFAQDEAGSASVRAWLRVRGWQVEVMEFVYFTWTGRGRRVRCRAQVVVVRDAGRRLPPAVQREFAVDRLLQTITLHVDRGNLIGWRDGELIPGSVDWQIGVMLGFLEGWPGPAAR